MNMHKRIRLTPYDRQAIWNRYCNGGVKVTTDLATQYRVTPPIIYKVLARARKQKFKPRNSTNDRYRALKYGLKRLAKNEAKLQAKQKAQARSYNKSYPGELMHFDIKRLPVLDRESATERREHLFVAIDDFSRELYAAILPDRTQHSSASFLTQVVDEFPMRLITPIQTMARNTEAAIIMSLLRPARPTASDRNSRVSIALKPTVKPSE